MIDFLLELLGGLLDESAPWIGSKWPVGTGFVLTKGSESFTGGWVLAAGIFTLRSPKSVQTHRLRACNSSQTGTAYRLMQKDYSCTQEETKSMGGLPTQPIARNDMYGEV